MLKTRTVWTLAGAGWGILVGLLTALQTAAFLAGVGWLFIFGDDKWPDAANWVLLIVTVIAALVPMILLTWLGRRLGIAFESESRQRIRTRRRGWFVFGLAAGGIALIAGLAAAGALTERAGRANREAAERQYAQLLAATHRISATRVEDAAPPEVAVDLTFEGSRAGAYVLDWRLIEGVYDSALVVGSRPIELGKGRGTARIAIDTAAVRAAYSRIVLKGRGGVLVEEDMALRLRLRPVLTQGEDARLPDREVRNLAMAVSGLLSDTTVAFPVRFELRPAAAP